MFSRVYTQGWRVGLYSGLGIYTGWAYTQWWASLILRVGLYSEGVCIQGRVGLYLAGLYTQGARDPYSMTRGGFIYSDVDLYLYPRVGLLATSKWYCLLTL